MCNVPARIKSRLQGDNILNLYSQLTEKGLNLDEGKKKYQLKYSDLPGSPLPYLLEPVSSRGNDLS